ncbi:hypothetical protein [Pseudomonas fluorescens group sp. PF-69]
MLGYMTAREAKAEGFTNHGKYFGIPVWIGDPEGDFMVATKWAPMEYLMDVAHRIEGMIHMMRGTEPSFMFLLGPEIE